MVSDLHQDGLRALRIEEESFIRTLLRHARDGEHFLPKLEGAQVRKLDDGKMGSFRFADDEHQSLGSCLVEAQYVDLDGVPVSVVLNADTSGRLYELDMWRVDFAPLQEYPGFERMTIET